MNSLDEDEDMEHETTAIYLTEDNDDENEITDLTLSNPLELDGELDEDLDEDLEAEIELFNQKLIDNLNIKAS